MMLILKVKLDIEDLSAHSFYNVMFLKPWTLIQLFPIMYGAYLSQHNHPWQRQGRVAGCLWHKRPEPGLDPSHLWEKRKNMGVRRGGEAGWRVAEGESDSWREKERQRQRGWGRKCIWFRWRYREAYVQEVCIYVRVFLKERQSVTRRIRISLHDTHTGSESVREGRKERKTETDRGSVGGRKQILALKIP